MKILVTGTAGFIGFHLAQALLARGDEVVGLDSINDYYDQRVKFGRLQAAGIAQAEINEGQLLRSTTQPGYRFVKLQLEDRAALEQLFATEKFDAVCNLAAQAGVRYSLQNPQAYIDANIVGFLNILECCRHHGVKNLSYASSSSVYGLNETLPFSTTQNVDHPISLYAASKKSNELMAHTYSHLFGIRTTGLRFFTVYGPWGRPDMALFLFTKAALAGEPIKVFNNGDMKRDFTYIDDIVDGVLRALDRPATGTPPHAIYNLGNNKAEKLTDFIAEIEKALGIKAEMKMEPMQPGDVPITYADITASQNALGFEPSTPISVGVPKFVDWFKDYYRA